MQRHIFVGLFLFFSIGFTQDFDDAVKFDFSLDKSSYKAGEPLIIHFDVNIKTNFHFYSTDPEKSLRPTVVEFYDSTYFDFYGEFTEPDPIIKYDKNFDMDVGIQKKKFRLSKNLKVSKNLIPGEYDVEGSLVYLACDPTMCIPKWDDFTIQLIIDEGIYENSETENTANTSMVDEAISEGFGSFILLAISMGFLALLTPCVFPMIPITVSFFTKMGESEGSSPLKSASVYTIGIITIFTVLGLLLAATLGATGANQIASNPWINILIGGLFVYFAFSLFGQYEIEMPSALRQFSMKQEQRGGVMGILFMAFTFTLTSFTCTVQFVGLLLVTASQGDYFWPVLGMVCFATAFALPFFFLALFPQYLSKLPQSGGWLNSVKVIMGFLELGAAFKFFSNTDLVWQLGIFTRPMVLASWTIIAILMGVYLLGKIRLPHDSQLEIIGVPRLMMSIACLSFGLYLSTGLFGQPIHGLIDSYLPPDFTYVEKSNTESISSHENLKWYEDFEEGMAKSKETQIPVFLDFTGYTCTNCRWMEMNIFEESEVIELFEQFILIRLYTDGGKNARKYQQMEVDRFGTAALPYYVILSPDDVEISRFAGMDTDINKFVTFLKKGLI
ncbi:MAG: thioredoxin family protein [Candidatus Marinimicrobia bacterium]|nr:thioredoxin family protein [Candidatus Neomarinimicrobiota bacterium]